MKLLKPWMITLLAPFFVRLYFSTIRIANDPNAQRRKMGRRPRVIYALWHANQLATSWHFRHLGMTLLASRHRDAEYIARVLEGMGYCAIRGSSTRGGAGALRGLMKALEGGRDVVITPDGPRGPRKKVKKGAIYLAARTGAPVVPGVVGLSDFYELKSWDRFRIPKPFARGYAMIGEPIHVPRECLNDDALAEQYLRRIEEAMNALESTADAKARELKYGR